MSTIEKKLDRSADDFQLIIEDDSVPEKKVVAPQDIYQLTAQESKIQLDLISKCDFIKTYAKNKNGFFQQSKEAFNCLIQSVENINPITTLLKLSLNDTLLHLFHLPIFFKHWQHLLTTQYGIDAASYPERVINPFNFLRGNILYWQLCKLEQKDIKACFTSAGEDNFFLRNLKISANLGCYRAAQDWLRIQGEKVKRALPGIDLNEFQQFGENTAKLHGITGQISLLFVYLRLAEKYIIDNYMVRAKDFLRLAEQCYQEIGRRYDDGTDITQAACWGLTENSFPEWLKGNFGLKDEKLTNINDFVKYINNRLAVIRVLANFYPEPTSNHCGSR